MQDLSKNILPDFLWAKLDIGGTNSAAVAATEEGGTAASKHWFPMTNAQTVTFLVFRDATSANNSDDPATLVIQQATSSAGAGVKTLKTYTYTALELTAGVCHVVTVQANEMDVAGGFLYVRPLLSMTDNAAVEFTHATAIGYNLRFPDDVNVRADASDFT